MSKVLPCIVCGKFLVEAFRGDETNLPYDGTVFRSHGHYGSTVFDPSPMDSAYLELNVCDDCLRLNSERVTHVAPVVQRSKYVVTTLTDYLDKQME